MRIVFFGTSDFAVPLLRAVASDTLLVVSQPDRPGRRGMQLQASPVKRAALEIGLACQTPEKCREPDFIEHIRSLEPDILLVAAYGQILPVALLESAKCGGINLHGSVLPEYRGAAPIQRCILEGRTVTGVTVMHMAKGMDTGDIIAVEEIAIGCDETYGELQTRLADLAAMLSVKWLPQIVEGKAPRTEQNHERATLASKVTKEEARIRFTDSAQQAYNRFRAFTPSPGAYIQLDSGVLRLSKVRLTDDQGKPGEILATSPDMVVAFDSGAFKFLEIQPEGKKRMSGKDFANGARLKTGFMLGEI
jgi:methionyl-tRNA formyltransferase